MCNTLFSLNENSIYPMTRNFYKRFQNRIQYIILPVIGNNCYLSNCTWFSGISRFRWRFFNNFRSTRTYSFPPRLASKTPSYPIKGPPLITTLSSRMMVSTWFHQINWWYLLSFEWLQLDQQDLVQVHCQNSPDDWCLRSTINLRLLYNPDPH